MAVWAASLLDVSPSYRVRTPHYSVAEVTLLHQEVRSEMLVVNPIITVEPHKRPIWYLNLKKSSQKSPDAARSSRHSCPWPYAHVTVTQVRPSLACMIDVVLSNHNS
ncbi:Protein of unknown function [Pyronema omphalodes CBS 100304]|uniref:Uncharacterized protein n=1 Tax=Pyronema omphalodes (strain CBS 100304) TaxID=1076935 RepID=U4LKZ2_PYROM|nr:Protein of unknown function [Pyronema omphalodes CBS 100304]